MSKVFLLFIVIASIFSSVESFVGSSGLCRLSTIKATYPSALLMSKASQEKADEKKRKQAMVSPMLLLSIVTMIGKLR